MDLCAGPHMDRTGQIKAVKLQSVAGAYWRGDSDRQMLQRIYGTCFPSQQELDDYIWPSSEEAKKRDHRKIGREMDLFALYEEGPGFPFFMPKGMIIRNELEKLLEERSTGKRGYRGDQDTSHPERAALEDFRTLGSLQGQHVLHEDRR